MENGYNKKFNSNYLSAAFIYLVSISFLINSFSIKDPQSRMFPTVICITTIILATLLVIRTKFMTTKKADEDNLTGMTTALKMLALLFLYVVGIEIVSFYIATPIYLSFTMLALGQKNKKLVVIVSLLFTLGVYLFFDLLLGMAVPMGRFLS
ncbi:MAG TPA: tripartite tricarboxylate transporter TctB family protein [Sedimentibacter sp.]|nr:tripartite tricarboxylate transporter TctB family protein [Sedimentibacter sp.]HOA20497.1 tripartite tricarboxylate transporter TctB family protein [Sedimentibacter sp.]HOG63522.1 tripartite tricarboxylate transporter TctB family protein [Sedimentibacter sp.]